MRRVLEELMAEKTFQPFAIVMNNGQRFEVSRFEFAVDDDDYITVLRPRSNAKDILRFSAISSLEILDVNEQD